MWVSHVFRLPGTYLGVLGHFQVIKGQKPAFLGHFWGMGSLWQWITLDWNVVSKKSDQIWNRGGKISVWRKNEPILLIRSASKIKTKKRTKYFVFMKGKWAIFDPYRCLGPNLFPWPQDRVLANFCSLWPCVCQNASALSKNSGMTYSSVYTLHRLYFVLLDKY